MRIISWNLLDGGRGNGSHKRLNRAVDIVHASAPDLVFFQEARDFDAHGCRLLDDVGGRLRLSGFLSPSDSGYHVAAFVRRDLAVTCTRFSRPDFFHALIGLRVALPDGGVLHALGAHWCPDSPDVRLTEAANLLKLVRDDEPTLVAGDLNSPDPHGDHTAAMAAMRPEDRARYCAPDGSTTADTRALRRLESAGLVDVGRLHGSTGHTLPTALPVPGAAFSPLRLDYFYATARLAATTTDYRVLRNAETDRISDHYPIVVDLDVTRLGPTTAEPS
ncbi:endonuclease/exonuclease/phosphatase family protein [Streptomyces acidiscabies]|uniref:Endonuclease/exonuclease/phosphatase family protein n=1 Tax=Streptomyces acidiscabies TaxID=42234 RepID=A0AAP6BGN7_9ACTN|nr:endonuclease/exonuclease/phosphatase family protein [Streptomyces acidiscabies]MBZ3916819.1 endonuclease/exonuclease/phosphatase family protein [Streptomyces acidiscabies]MDX2964421.1 endonuclease/exonuclease/phosphatase family protein [Streptomyces acidiscabies]MDX3022970.1 endonuclease/exonuclease/phosphatase family protein [Streptomyces acidiscabies]MDX3794244.1 endonuclease/exonuclease/phosphatase family protein [Streptomyces acidiscabies]GAQ52568.1 endonuclease/exonuclease/phosphatase 